VSSEVRGSTPPRGGLYNILVLLTEFLIECIFGTWHWQMNKTVLRGIHNNNSQSVWTYNLN